MTFKDCYNDCGIRVETRMTDGKWLPYEESGRKHDCPNSEYNKKKRGQQELGEGPAIFKQEPTEQEWRNLQEKNDHGNEISFHAKDNSLQFVGTGSQESTVTIKQNRKVVLRKRLVSNDPAVLDDITNEFVMKTTGKAGVPWAVWRPDHEEMEYGECVYYEAEV